ncbi:hypothetical protein E2562_028743 [Oryza meyeriana var. granulata]|uniref:Uncharacterized protein n=1 Tax=Oryza meyeriana var. granulata TaxID=110450 RepID=A0A6G1D971_9ORYZ|nr:hypothetical protein E2562_028743 [Oryza meyeriana var. granulata]
MPSQLLLSLLAAAAAAALAVALPSEAAAAAPPPAPTPWPERFHAVLFTNMTQASGGGRLKMTDLYYDWPGGRNLNLVTRQLSDDPIYDVEWTNGTSYYFNSTSCRTMLFRVGILPPDWLADGAVYLGRETVDGFDCHVWTKVDFIWYYEDVVTHRPVRWNFYTGMQQHVMSFEVGGVLEDSKWQAPAYCFNDKGAAANSTTANDKIDGEIDVMTSFLRFVGGQQTAVAAV